MIVSILHDTPVWVWVILAALIGLGGMQTRARTISLARATVLPLVFVVLSLSSAVHSAGGGLNGTDATYLVLSAWVVGFAAVAWLGRRRLAVGGARWLAAERRIHVPGSGLPLFLMVGLFLLKYATAVAAALAPALARQPAYLVGCNLVYGAFAAAFWIRGNSLRRLVAGRAATVAPTPARG
jgi:hypothetical protein